MKSTDKNTTLLVFSPLYPPHTGGLENHAFQFNEHMAKAGYTIIVFTPLITPNTPARKIQNTTVTILRFPAFKIIPNYPIPKFWRSDFWAMWKEVWNAKPDIVISRTRFFITSPMAHLYAKIHRKPWVHIEHGSDFVKLSNPMFSFIARLFDYTLGAFTLNSANAVVANSKASAAFVKRLAPEVAPHVIYRGVEHEKIEAIQPDVATKKKHKDEIIISYVGRLISGKGVKDLLDAFTAVTHPHKHLFIIGTGPEREPLQLQAKRLNITSQVTFFGDTHWEKAMSLLKVSDIVVNPSYTEGLPTSVIEAALCGAAIIATDVGGTSEIITHNKSGILIEPRNSKELTRAIQQLIDNPTTRQKIVIEAKEQAQIFTWSHSVSHYTRILRKRQKQRPHRIS